LRLADDIAIRLEIKECCEYLRNCDDQSDDKNLYNNHSFFIVQIVEVSALLKDRLRQWIIIIGYGQRVER